MEIITLDRENFRPYMGEFAELYTQSFRVPMDEQEVVWRYFDNPNGDILACIAVDKGKLVANYSASPIHLIQDGRIIKVALSLNTMTHPDYSGQGLFVKLASRVYRRMYETGYQMIMGFPNNNSNRTFVKTLGWHDIQTVPTLQLNLAEVKKREHENVGSVRQDNAFVLDYSARNEVRPGVAVYKSRDYLKWRYQMHPAFTYYNFVICSGTKVTSHIILKLFRDRVNIVESFFANEDEMKCLLNKAIDFGNEHDKKMITIWLKLGSWQHMIYEQYGAILAAPVTYFGANVFGDEVEKSIFYHPETWTLNMSDDNVY